MDPAARRRRIAGPQRLHAGAQDLGRRDRLAEEIGDPDLQEPARQGIVEGVGQDHDGCTTGKARHQALQGHEALAAAGFQVDEDGGHALEVGGGADLLDRLGQHGDGDRAHLGQCRGQRFQRGGVAADQQQRDPFGRGGMQHGECHWTGAAGGALAIGASSACS